MGIRENHIFAYGSSMLVLSGVEAKWWVLVPLIVYYFQQRHQEWLKGGLGDRHSGPNSATDTTSPITFILRPWFLLYELDNNNIHLIW